jgi:hypothetical protein
MRRSIGRAILGTLLGVALAAGQTPSPSPAADEKPDCAELSRLIKAALAAQLPKQYEDKSQWGMTIPIPPGFRVGPRRTLVRVGDHDELPHGAWKRTKLWVDDPAKDVRITIREFRKVEGKPSKLVLEATAALHVERQRRQWQRGLQLLDVTVQGDAVVRADVECDVSVALDAKKLPPELVVEAKITQCRLDLKEFELKQVGRLEIFGEIPKLVSEELRTYLQGVLKDKEPELKEKANLVIARVLKDGKGSLSPERLLPRPQPGK